uniref:Adhesion G protein-coupled receptor D1 n=1 Tax=Oreochromis niloticus TaxID=8128 RepID=A0A669FAA5_ORENI
MAFCLRIRIFTAFVSFIKVYAQVAQAQKHPGLEVLDTASHYWPLDAVEGIHELWDHNGNRSGYINGSNINIVEGMVNKGIFLNGDNGGTFLHFGNYQNTCISDPNLCGPEGITFSFFWKNHESASRFAVASGGKVISNGFSVYTNPLGGYVEFYTRSNKHRWRANIKVPGPYWTHILFTWTKKDGLKVYINATLTAENKNGSISEETYGDPYPDLVIGTANNKRYSHYVTGAFDEFVIWEKALSPENISLYYNATIAWDMVSETTPRISKEVISTTPMARAADMSPPVISSLQEELRPTDFLPVQSFLKTLPNGTISRNTANNLTQGLLRSVEEMLSFPGLTEQSTPVVNGLVKTVDRVMEHVVTNLEDSPNSLISLDGTSFVAAQTTIVGLFYHNMHSYYKEISPVKTRINEAADYKDHKIHVASCLISLKVEPLPALSVNLSGAPLIKIVLTHVLTKEQQDQVQNQSNKVFLYCAYLDYSSKEGVWSNEGCVRADGNMTYSVCLCNHLTNFAILMQVVPLKISTGHKVALSTIGYVGCSISIFCLAITLVTFAVLSSVSTIRNQRYHIHANLSFAILVAEILLLISARFDPGTLPCKVMAVLLHFFFLSAFAWMLVEGLHLYSMVIKVFGSEDSKHFYYYGIGWGSPFLICVVSMTSALDSYGKVDNCWLSLQNGAIWAFVAPALFVIVVNIGILISVTRIISRISGENYKVHGDANAVKLTIKAVAVLLPILGISWIFGVLVVNTQSLPFLYIFAVFNSLQGFFVFLFHCLLNSEVRAAFKHKTKVWSLTSSSIRNINVKPFNSDIMNGHKEGVTPTKMNTWDKSTNSANRIDLSAV